MDVVDVGMDLDVGVDVLFQAIVWLLDVKLWKSHAKPMVLADALKLQLCPTSNHSEGIGFGHTAYVKLGC